MKGTWNMKDGPYGSSKSGRGERLLRERYKPNTVHHQAHFSITKIFLWGVRKQPIFVVHFLVYIVPEDGRANTIYPEKHERWCGKGVCRSAVDLASRLQPGPFVQPPSQPVSLDELRSSSIQVQCILATIPAAPPPCLHDRARWAGVARPECTSSGFSAVCLPLVLHGWDLLSPWSSAAATQHGGFACWEGGAAGWDEWSIVLKNREVQQSELQQSFVTRAGRQTR